MTDNGFISFAKKITFFLQNPLTVANKIVILKMAIIKAKNQ